MCDLPIWINVYNFNLPQAEENGPKYKASEKIRLLSTFWGMDCLGAHEFHSLLPVHTSPLSVHILLPVLKCIFRIFFLSQCKGVNELHVLCQGPIFNLSNTSQFRMFPLRCGTSASYISNCNVLNPTNAIMELQIQVLLNTLPYDFLSNHRHSTGLPFSVCHTSYNFIYKVRATETQP